MPRTKEPKFQLDKQVAAVDIAARHSLTHSLSPLAISQGCWGAWATPATLATLASTATTNLQSPRYLESSWTVSGFNALLWIAQTPKNWQTCCQQNHIPTHSTVCANYMCTAMCVWVYQHAPKHHLQQQQQKLLRRQVNCLGPTWLCFSLDVVIVVVVFFVYLLREKIFWKLLNFC